MQHDGKPCLVKGFHDNRSHSLIICKKVEDGEEEEEAESESEKKEKEMKIDDTTTTDCNWFKSTLSFDSTYS